MKIGAVTIGQSPRDDIIPEIREVLGSEVEIIEKGALDDLSLNDVKDFHPKPEDYTLVTRLKDGTEVKIAKKHIIPKIRSCIRELEEKGAGILILLCTGEFPEFETQRILLRPDRIMQNTVQGILEKGRLGVIVPYPEQIPFAEKKWEPLVTEVVSESVSPYTGTDEDIIEKAHWMKNMSVDLIVLDCIGFNRKIKSVFREITKKPVLLPRTIVGRIAQEIA